MRAAMSGPAPAGGTRATALALAALLLALAGCGGGRGGAAATSRSHGATAHEVGAGSIELDVADSEAGPILVDSQGMSLYVFSADVDGKTACGVDCAQYWPSLSLPPDGRVRVEGGARAGLVGHGQAVGPNRLVTYAGHPLYTFSDDAEPGDTKGQDVRQFGGVWHLVSPSGQPRSAPTSDSLAHPGAL